MSELLECDVCSACWLEATKHPASRLTPHLAHFTHRNTKNYDDENNRPSRIYGDRERQTSVAAWKQQQAYPKTPRITFTCSPPHHIYLRVWILHKPSETRCIIHLTAESARRLHSFWDKAWAVAVSQDAKPPAEEASKHEEANWFN